MSFGKTFRALTVLCFWLLLTGCATDKLLRQATKNCPPSNDPRFETLLTELTDIQLVDGNSVTELINGEQFFPAMLTAIQNAKERIDFENFVWRSGAVSTAFINALTERARAGVNVHFMVDALGAGKLSNDDFRKLRKAGVEVAKYNPVGFTTLFRLNHRTHRKTLVVDGKIGFIGGISIADEWLAKTENPKRWRDSNYCIEGPAVAQLEEIFAVNWKQTTGTDLPDATSTKAFDAKGASKVACFMSGPGEGEHDARRVYLLSIAAAQKSIRLAHSYFLPDDFALELLLDARRRGVDVEIITPGIINYNLVRRASRSRWKHLLDAGVKFYEYQPVKYHPKLMIVDDLWVTAGSVNFDPRSFRINDEANFLARDKKFAATQIATFEADKKLSARIDPEEFRRRSVFAKIFENVAGWLRFQL